MLWNLEVQYLAMNKFNIKKPHEYKKSSVQSDGNVDLNIGTQSCQISLFI